MMFRNLVQQVGSLVISLFLAVFVWVYATSEENPTRESPFPDPIPIQLINRADGLTVSSRSADSVHIIVRAPEARWQNLRRENFQAVGDLRGMGSGNQPVQVAVTSSDPQVTVLSADPSAITVRLEPLKQVPFDVQVHFLDDPPIGYEVKSTTATPARVTVTGPQSLVDTVSQVSADVTLRGAKTSFDGQVGVVLHDAQGNVISDPNLVVSPAAVAAHVEVVQRVGYKEVAIKAVLRGSVSSGYWVSDIKVDPATATLFGSPNALDQIPGFIEALPVVVTGAQQDIEKTVGLALPAGVSALNTADVKVSVSVEPVLSGITILRSVSGSDNRCGLPVTVSPDTVEVILSGPLPILQALTADDVQIVVDAAGCNPGSYQVNPRAVNVPGSIRVESIVPNTVEINIRQK